MCKHTRLFPYTNNEREAHQSNLHTPSYTASHSRVMRWGRYSAIMLDVNISSQLQSDRAAITLCSEDMLLSIVSDPNIINTY